MNDASMTFDTVVVGGGPAGLTAAISLAGAGARTALLARRLPYEDNRTTALLGTSVDLLERLEVWHRCRDSAAPLKVMRLVDDTGRLVRAPEVRFASEEIGLEQFGFNVDNRTLVAALEARAAELTGLTRIDDVAASVTPANDAVTIVTQQATTIVTQLVIGSDGRQSLCREAAGITTRRRVLNQSALTFNVSHSRPHKNISTEFHTSQGPCVLVPLPGNRCSVVWVAAPGEAERLVALDDDEFSVVVEQRSHSILGRTIVEPGRYTFPLAIERPSHIARNRIALVGESAHVVPPIGAQGLNMSLRDAADLAGIVRETIPIGGDPGSPHVLQRYAAARRSDIASRTFVIDIANRSLLSDFLPVQTARAAGMYLIDAIPALRRWAMREGLAPTWRI